MNKYFLIKTLYIVQPILLSLIDLLQECKKLGKQSFRYAWVMDETAEERSRGVTTDVAVVRLKTGQYSHT